MPVTVLSSLRVGIHKTFTTTDEGWLQFADGDTEAQRESLGPKVTGFQPAEWEAISPV